MLWVGLATLLMLITGAGDDTRAFRQRQEAMNQALEEVVAESARREAAKSALEATSRAFEAHRKRLDVSGRCIQEVDAHYEATPENYAKCFQQIDQVWDTAIEEFLDAESDFRSALRPDELGRINARVFPE